MGITKLRFAKRSNEFNEAGAPSRLAYVNYIHQMHVTVSVWILQTNNERPFYLTPHSMLVKIWKSEAAGCLCPQLAFGTHTLNTSKMLRLS